MRLLALISAFANGIANPRARWPRQWMFLLAVGLCVAALTPAALAQTTSVVEGGVTDQQGAAIAGAEVRVSNASLAIERQTTSDSKGEYRIPGLPAAVYSLTVTKEGFSTYKLNSVEVTLNRTVTLDAVLQVASVQTEISVMGVAPLLEPTISSSGDTVTPAQIQAMPLNGRNYLDLMQLVPGVAINRQQTGDAATPVLGERGGNTLYLIDGMPNSDQVTGGAASQFNQESILEFQVVTAGYKAEFGHASGGVVNVISKGGTNLWHGGASLFHRNYKLDASDIQGQDKAPFLLRWDPSFQLGGPILKDRIFFFASGERIREARALNFGFPANTPQFLIDRETPYIINSQTYDARLRARLDEQWGHHRFTQQANWTNTQVTGFRSLSLGTSLPSTAGNTENRHLILGFNDTATLGNQGNPFLLSIYGQYRGEPSRTHAAHPELGTLQTTDVLFNSIDDNTTFGNGTVIFGYSGTPKTINQKYTSFGANLGKHFNRHDLKFGFDFQRMVVDGIESTALIAQLYATIGDQIAFPPLSSGVYLLQGPAPRTVKDSTIALRNNYSGLFVQDDVKLFKNLTINAGLRWDYDSRFPTNGNVSPRLGLAWSVTPKTIIRGSWGLFYDHFRLGLAEDIPGFGGANVIQQTSLAFPRLLYGNPSNLVAYFSIAGYNVPCVSSNLTDAQILATGAVCHATLAAGGAPITKPAATFYGIDHLNNVVAAGHAPIPANAVVNISNIQQLSGLTPDQFAAQAAAALGKGAIPNYLSWDQFGNLSIFDGLVPNIPIPVTVDPGFKVPYSMGYQFGIQRELTPDIVVQADYHHKDLNDILGTRWTNLAIAARLKNNRALQAGTGTYPINGFGPWYSGQYDGLVLSVRKRMSHHFSLDATYTWANETDDVVAYTGTGTNHPSDSFVGVPEVVTEAGTATGACAHAGVALTNATGPFIAANCNPVPQAGKFYNGPNFDKGNSDLALRHTFQVYGVLRLPWKFEYSGIFRVQSGFHYSRQPLALTDIDGDGQFGAVDHGTPPGAQPGSVARNQFTAPTFKNVDMRLSKRFDIGERARLYAYFEMFNLFNTANPAAIELQQNVAAAPFGSVQQALPGREGQVGLRIEF
jgi:outer membrane receptor for ferrienterochelin and colicin